MKSLSHVQLCNPVDCSLPSSCVHGILKSAILEWVATAYSRGSSWPRDQNPVSCMDRRILYHLATCEAPEMGETHLKLKTKQKKNKDCWQHQKLRKEHGTDSFPEISVREWPCQFLDFGLLASRDRINFYCCKPSSFWYFVTSASTWPPGINSEPKVGF